MRIPTLEPQSCVQAELFLVWCSVAVDTPGTDNISVTMVTASVTMVTTSVTMVTLVLPR